MGCKTCGTVECDGVGEGHETEKLKPSEMKLVKSLEKKASTASSAA